ncbi:MAG: class I SAM-dependent methyltransferase [Deltaproteobacteria bacterium]|nr:MAG: class I SAM-dependent methyltransferase [Deltaproteobacteria bacterium]
MYLDDAALDGGERMSMRVRRPGVRDGYDAWSTTYDETPNPLVALDRRYTMRLLEPRPSERILDAGCGTGAYLRLILLAGSSPFGLDLSRGMLRVARRRLPSVPLAQANLDDPLPVRGWVFDAVLCALVGEHLENVSLLFREFSASLVAGGRLIFSVFHPEMAAAGIEANFEREGVEYRLGARRYSVDDYVDAVDRSGFRGLRVHEFCGDAALADEIPWAAKYLSRPLLLTVEARKT